MLASCRGGDWVLSPAVLKSVQSSPRTGSVRAAGGASAEANLEAGGAERDRSLASETVLNGRRCSLPFLTPIQPSWTQNLSMNNVP